MSSLNSESKFGRFVEKAEFKLILALAYVVSLAGTFIYSWVKLGRLACVVFTFGRVHIPIPALVVIHVLFMLVVGCLYFLPELLMFFCSPVGLVLLPLSHLRARRYLKCFTHNRPAEVVVILGYPDWFKLEGWLKPVFFRKEMKTLAEHLTKKRQHFSFYPNASRQDVDYIMSNRTVKEVYFYGHGNSHGFELATGEVLYYCEFDDPKYGKSYVHQVHCGTSYGKSLIDYVVPPESRSKCFLFRKSINAPQIIREFRRRTKELESSGEINSGR